MTGRDLRDIKSGVREQFIILGFEPHDVDDMLASFGPFHEFMSTLPTFLAGLSLSLGRWLTPYENPPAPKYGPKTLPYEGQVVFVEGGIAQFRNGVFYTGMEAPVFCRPIKWNVEWWLPMTAKGIYEAVRTWDSCSICRQPIIDGKWHILPCE